MHANSRVVLPGYESYRSVLSYEAAVYNKPETPVVKPDSKVEKSSVIKEVVADSLKPTNSVPLPAHLLKEGSEKIPDLARDDADELLDSDEYYE